MEIIRKPRGSNRSLRKKSEVPDGEDEAGAGAGGVPVGDVLELRRLRRKGRGVAVEDLQRGDRRKGSSKGSAKRRREEGLDGGGFVGGLGEAVGSNAFTGASTRMDAEKHRDAFVEAELRRRRHGSTGSGSDSDTSKSLEGDPRLDALSVLPDLVVDKQPGQLESDLKFSASMLTTVPEVELGIECVLLTSSSPRFPLTISV